MIYKSRQRDADGDEHGNAEHLANWQAVDSGEGDYYYWNTETNETTWAKPVAEKKPTGPPPRT